MTETQQYGETTEQQAPAWKPLLPIERRITGVLIEKAKTTPDSYPLSLNALTTGCNQKSNRSPQMTLDADDVEEAIENLRVKGAVGVIQGGGRVVKYRHYMRDWLAVDGNELAVVAELLLRGPQTVGELRGRAARMAPIPDLGALRPVLDSLTAKGLVVPLTAEERGQLVTHGLYTVSELERIRREQGSGGPPAGRIATGDQPRASQTSPTPTGQANHPLTAPTAVVVDNRNGPATATGHEIAALRQEFQELTREVLRLRKEVEDLWTNVR